MMDQATRDERKFREMIWDAIPIGMGWVLFTYFTLNTIVTYITKKTNRVQTQRIYKGYRTKESEKEEASFCSTELQERERLTKNS